MTHHQETLAFIRDVMAKTPPEECNRILACAEQLRTVIGQYGTQGYMALALVGAEIAVVDA